MRLATTFCVAALFAFALCATPGFADFTLFEDNFDGAGTLAGRTPDVGNAWDGDSHGTLSGSGRALLSGGSGEERATVFQDFTLPPQSSGESLIFELQASVVSGGAVRGGSFLLAEPSNYEYFIPGLGGNPEGSPATDTYWRGSWLNTAPGSGAAAFADTTESSTTADTITRVTATANTTAVDFVYEVSTDSGANFSLMGGSAANATMTVQYADMSGGAAGPENPPTFDRLILLTREGPAQIDAEYVRVTQTGDPLPPDPTGTQFEWNASNVGDWGTPGNWTILNGVAADPDIRANDANHAATFGGLVSGPTTVSTQAAVSINRIVFDNATNSYAVAGLGSVNLHTTTDPNNPVTPTMSVNGSHRFQASVNLRAATTVDVASGSQLVFDGTLNLDGNTLTKSGTGSMVVNNQLLAGGGVILGNVAAAEGVVGGSGKIGGDLNNSGATVAPGNSPGILSVSGDYTQGSGGTLEIEVEGTGAGTGHDQLAVSNTASLDGTLDIQTGSGFTPGVGGSVGVIGDTYTIVTANTRSGEFATVNGKHAGAGIFYDVAYNATNVTLGAFQAQIGDTDGDRDVDLTDFGTLSANFAPGGAPGADWTTGDFDMDGDVDLTDFGGLSANFAPNGYAGVGGQVPEPTTTALLGIGGLLLLFSYLRRRK